MRFNGRLDECGYSDWDYVVMQLTEDADDGILDARDAMCDAHDALVDAMDNEASAETLKKLARELRLKVLNSIEAVEWAELVDKDPDAALAKIEEEIFTL